MKHLLVASLVCLSLGSTAARAEEPENYIKYRQAMMSAIGGHMGASTQILRGKVAPEGDLDMHARALAELSAQLTRLFPEGSDFGETKAKAVIWENWDKFEQAADDTRQTSAAFAAAVAGGDAGKIEAAHKELGKSCKGCHEDFRQKDD
jgi:cytochrome c556